MKIQFLEKRFLRTAPLSPRSLGLVWRPLVSGEFSSENQRIAVIGMFFGEVTGQWSPVLFAEQTVFKTKRAKKTVIAALAWCHIANLEVKDVKIRPDSKYAIGVLDKSHRCISHVRLVRTTR